MLALVTEAEAWDWSCVEAAQYESLAQWWVMSVDCRVAVRHPDRSTLDEAVIRLLRAAAGFGAKAAGPGSVGKQRVWVRCSARLLATCGSKQRNFLAHHQPGLHSGLRKLLEDIGETADISPPAATGLVRDYLGAMNSPSSSVLPGSSLTVLQSWLHTASPSTVLLHSLLNQAGVGVTDAKIGRASCRERV